MKRPNEAVGETNEVVGETNEAAACRSRQGCGGVVGNAACPGQGTKQRCPLLPPDEEAAVNGDGKASWRRATEPDLLPSATYLTVGNQ